jgi:hypothetical protein
MSTDVIVPAVGDEIGVFTSDGLCVGASVWTGLQPLDVVAWRDDSQTAAIDGFVRGDVMFFRVWDASASECAEFSGIPVYDIGNGTFGYQTHSVISMLNVVPPAKEVIVFDQGWSWVSTNVQPEYADMSYLFRNIPQLGIVVNGDGQFYIPGMTNGIGNWDATQGYKVYLSTPDSITMIGEKIKASTPISLEQGWNFISYLPQHAIATETAIATVVGKMEIIKNDAGKFYIPGVMKTMDMMEPLEGYKLYLKESATLVYPASQALAKADVQTTNMTATNHFTCAQNSDENYVIIIDDAVVNGNAITTGDEIAVVTKSGLCVGAAKFDGRYPLAIISWADDNRTETVDGYVAGDDMQFRIWRAATNVEMIATAAYSKGKSQFGSDNYGHVSLLSATTTDITSTSGAVPTAFALHQNYPNPFNPETRIQFDLPTAEHVIIKIYNVHGQLVETLLDSRMAEGVHAITWNATHQPSGIYVCYVQAGTFKKSMKLMLVK